MPDGFTAFRQTPLFNQGTVPKGLIKDHTTAAGTWACIVVNSGKLKYAITEPGHEAEFILQPQTPGVIMAAQKHHISVIDNVSFYVEFYRKAEEPAESKD